MLLNLKITRLNRLVYYLCVSYNLDNVYVIVFLFIKSIDDMLVLPTPLIFEDCAAT